MSADLLRRRGLEAAAAVAGAAALLGGVFWVARGWPALDPCDGFSPAGRRAVDAFQAGAVPLHAAAGAMLLLALVRLSAAWSPGRRPGIPTAVAATAYAALLAATLADPHVLLAVGTLPAFFLVVTVPLTSLALLVAVVLLVGWPAEEDGAGWAAAALWCALLLVLPGHFTAVLLVDDPWFCS